MKHAFAFPSMQRSLHRPVIIVFAADLAAKLLLGLVWLLLIRYLAPGEFALLTLAAAVAAVASQTLGATINRLYILGGTGSAPNERGRLIILQLAALLCLAAAGLPFSGALPGGIYSLTALLAAGILLSDFAKTLYQKELRFSAYSLVELARAALVSITLAILLAKAEDAVHAWQVLAVQAGALWMVSLLVLHRRVTLRHAFSPGRALPEFNRVFAGGHRYLFGYFAVLALFSQTDILMLKALSDAETLASYGSASRYYQLLSLALTAVHAVFLPSMQKLTNGAELERFFARHLRMLLFFAVGVTVAALAAAWLIPWIDRGRYPDAVPVFQILCVSAIISFAFSPHVNLVFTYRRFRFLFFLIVGALSVNTALNFIMIPAIGGRGAALATLAASSCVTIPIFILSRRLRRRGAAATRLAATPSMKGSTGKDNFAG